MTLTNPRVLHITVGLGVGGAEKIMEDIVSGLKDKYDLSIVSIKERGPVEAIRAIRRGGYDILHGHCFWGGVFACLFKGKGKAIWHQHMKDARMAWHRRLIEWLVIRRADVVIGVCEAVGLEMKRRNPSIAERVRVVRNGTEIPKG